MPFHLVLWQLRSLPKMFIFVRVFNYLSAQLQTFTRTYFVYQKGEDRISTDGLVDDRSSTEERPGESDSHDNCDVPLSKRPRSITPDPNLPTGSERDGQNRVIKKEESKDITGRNAHGKEKPGSIKNEQVLQGLLNNKSDGNAIESDIGCISSKSEFGGKVAATSEPHRSRIDDESGGNTMASESTGSSFWSQPTLPESRSRKRVHETSAAQQPFSFADNARINKGPMKQSVEVSESMDAKTLADTICDALGEPQHKRSMFSESLFIRNKRVICASQA